jgi:hypothetical protein
METDEQPLKATNKISTYSYIFLKALLIIISAAALFITTWWAFHHHHHQGDLGGNLLIGRVPTTQCQILEGNSIACYPHCLEDAAVKVKVHPSTPVCNSIPSPSSLSGPSKDVSSSSALVMPSNYSNNIPPSLQPQSQLSHQNSTQPSALSYGPTTDPSSDPLQHNCQQYGCSQSSEVADTASNYVKFRSNIQV